MKLFITSIIFIITFTFMCSGCSCDKLDNETTGVALLNLHERIVDLDTKYNQIKTVYAIQEKELYKIQNELHIKKVPCWEFYQTNIPKIEGYTFKCKPNGTSFIITYSRR